jgi:RNA polymerase-binding transcription factor
MPPPPKKGPLKPITKKEAISILDTLKEKLLRDINDQLKSETGEEKEIGDLYDLASNERDRELSLLLNDRERLKLVQIEKSYERIEDGTYGFCENCAEPIAPGRIRAIPFTTFCVECKSIMEREESMVRQRHLLDDRTYQGLADTDFDDSDN